MIRARVLAIALVPLAGCASLIGASFDDAHPAGDAASEAAPSDVAHEQQEYDAGEEPPPFDPRTLPGLALWLDATQGVEVDDAGPPHVTVWHDLSPNQYDALPVASSFTYPPTLVAGAMAQKAVVHFDSSKPDMLRSSWIGPGGPDLTIFVVGRGYLHSALRFQNNYATVPLTIFPLDTSQNAAAPTFYFYEDVVPGKETALAIPLDGGPAVLEATWRADAGTAATFVDGKLVEQRLVTDPALPNNQVLCIGGVLPYPGNAYFANGDLAEAIVYDSALDEGARRAVESYLEDKWAIGP